MKREFTLAGGIKASAGRGSAGRLLGPGGGGAQFIPTVSPHDPRRMLVACDMTGAYITQNGGNTWAQFNLRDRVHSFAFDPIEPDTIYAGGTGLFRSTDGGANWQLLFPSPKGSLVERMDGDHAEHSFLSNSNWPGGEIQCISIDEDNNSVITIGIYAEKRLLLYRSEDRGVSWKELISARGSMFHAVIAEPKCGCGTRRLVCFTDREAFVLADGASGPEAIGLPGGCDAVKHAAWGTDPMTGTSVFFVIAGAGGGPDGRPLTGLWKSEDVGRTWQPLAVRLGGDTPAGAGPVELTILAVPERNARVLYAGVGCCPEYGRDTGAGSVHTHFGVIRSDDGGASWRWVLKSDYETDPLNLQAGWAERDYGLPWYMTGPKGVGPIGLGVCPANPDICCATDLSSSFLTMDGGESWRQIYSADNPNGSVSSRGLEVTTCYGVHFDPFDVKHIAVSYTDIGMFHSQDRGHSWLHGISGVPVPWGNTCYWIVFDPDVRGRSWSAWGGAHDLPRPKMMRSGSFHRHEGGVCVSTDGMASWRLSNRGMPGNSVVTHLVLDPSSPAGNRTLYAAVFDRGVYKSVDGGATWALKDGGIAGNRNAWRLTLLPDGTLFLPVARGLRGREVVGGALYKSTDGAELWERIPLPAGVNAPNDLVYDPSDPCTMYLSCWPDESDGDGHGGGLYETRNGGASWKCVFDESAHAYATAVHPQNSDVLFLVTFDSAAWYSEDRGNTWKQIEGYDFKWGHRPVVDPLDESMLYITTFGSSVWYGPWK